MDIYGVSAILGGAALIFGATIYESRKTRHRIAQTLEALPEFTATQKLIVGNSGIAADEARGSLALIVVTSKEVSVRVVSFRDIISAEIFEDGSSVTRTERTSQLAGSLVGGLALGGVGAIIGGLSGNTITTKKCKRIDLRLVVNDTKIPIHDLTILNIEVDRDGSIYDSNMKIARHWNALIAVMIKRADQEDKKSSASRPAENPSSIADELKKLAELRDSGVLSNEEFQNQKANLLRGQQVQAG